MGVILRHSVTGAVIETTAIGDDRGEAQAKLHEGNGWVRVPETAIDEAVAETGQAGAALLAVLQERLAADKAITDALDSLKRDELLERAEAAGIDVPAKATKAEIIDALNSADQTKES